MIYENAMLIHGEHSVGVNYEEKNDTVYFNVTKNNEIFICV